MGKFAFGALWISLTLSAFGQQQTPDYDKVEIKLQKLSGNVYMLQGLGGNVVAYAGKDATVLVDCEEVELGPKIEAALKTISDKPVKYVLNTHWHGDHTGGNAYFGKTATIIAHDNVRKKMATEQDRRITNLAISLPLITFSDEITLHMDAGEIHAVHFAHGHSDGDSVVFYPEANVVQMGDDFTNFVPPHYPAIDTDNDGTGGPQGAIAAAQYVLEHSSNDVKIVPGHGILGSKDDLSKYLALLQVTSAAVQAGIDQGKSLDQLKQEKILAKWDYLDSAAIRTDVYLERLYKGLLAQRNGNAKSGGY